MHEYLSEGALIPSIISVGNAIWNSKKNYNINTIVALFLKDYYHTSTEERPNVQKTIEAIIESYYSALFKMTGNCELGNSKNTRNPAFTSLRSFLDNIDNNMLVQPLSLRVWF